MPKEMQDSWGDDAGGSNRAPTVSYKFAIPGEPSARFTGVVVAPDVTYPSKGYELVQRSDKDGKYVWPPDGYTNPNPKKGPRSPILEAAYRAFVGNDDEMRPVGDQHVTFATEYRSREFFSAPARERSQEDENFRDTGLRRVIIDGADLPGKIRDALTKIKAKRAEVGQTWTVTLASQVPNTDKEGNTNKFDVTIEAPTPATLKIAADHLSAAKAAQEEATFAPSGAANDTEPPF